MKKIHTTVKGLYVHASAREKPIEVNERDHYPPLVVADH
jgi:hypothetical protein